jgi:hypothetical protein
VSAEQTNRGVDEASEPSPRRALALRWHLVLLVVGAMLPPVVFAAVVAYRLADSDRAAADRVRALRTGFQAHLSKPVDPAALINTLITLDTRRRET